MTTEATRECHGIRGLPVPSNDDATAFIASLLSEPNPEPNPEPSPEVETGEHAPASPPSPVLIEEASDSIPTECSAPVSPAAHNEYILPPAITSRAPRRHLNTGLCLLLIALSAFIFGAGLAVGYGMLGRLSKSVSSLAAVQPAPVPPVNPTADSPAAVITLHAQEHADALRENGSGNSPQKPVAEARNLPNREPNTGPNRETDALADEPLNREAPIGSMRSENRLPAAKAPEIPAATASSSSVALLVPEAHAVIEKPPEQPSEAAPAPAGAPPGNVVPCQLVHSVQPVYPDKAKKVHVEGDVELRVVVGVDGSVRSVGLVRGPNLLVPAAMDAARGFRYNPALLNGKPIETVQTIQMSFKLNR